MSVAEARNNYTGLGGCKRMNCAQSVISAFKEKFGIEDAIVDSFKAYGGGNAPTGLCGAYYAAKFIIERCDKEKAKELEQYFLSQAGDLACSSIRKLKKLSCVGCVEKSSEFLDRIS